MGTHRCLPRQRSFTLSSATLRICCNILDFVQYSGARPQEWVLWVFNAFWLFMTLSGIRQLPLMSGYLRQFCPIRRDKYLQTYIRMSQYLLQGEGEFCSWPSSVGGEIGTIIKKYPTLQYMFLIDLLPHLAHNPAWSHLECSYENQRFQQHTPKDCPAPTKSTCCLHTGPSGLSQ